MEMYGFHYSIIENSEDLGKRSEDLGKPSEDRDRDPIEYSEHSQH